MPHRSHENLGHRIINAVGDFFRASVAGTGVFLLSTYGVATLQAQTSDPNFGFFELALKQGGIFGLAARKASEVKDPE